MQTPIKQPITAQDMTGPAFASVERRMKTLDRTANMVGNAMSKIAGPFIVALGAREIANFGKAAIDAADNINDMSQRLGLSTEALSQYQYVAKMSGTDFDTLTTAIKFSERAISEAAGGSKSAADALADVGLTAKDLAALSPEAAFEAIGDAISKLPAAADRTNASMKLMGRSGADLIPMFRDGAGGVRAMREEADRLGLTLDQLSAEKAARANDAIDKMKLSFGALGRELALSAGPAIEQAAAGLTGLISNVAMEIDWSQARKESQDAPQQIQEAFADAWREGGKRGAVDYWTGYKAEMAKAAKTGIFAIDAPLLPGMTDEGRAQAKAYQTEVSATMLAGLKSVQAATDRLTTSERTYFQALELSVQAAQERALAGDSAYASGLIALMDTDDQTRTKEAESLARHNREVQAAIDEYEQLRRESTLTWQMMDQGVAMVTDQLSNNLAAAIAGAKTKLIDLASIAESLLSMAFQYAIRAGFAALTGGASELSGAGAAAGIPGVMPVPGVPSKALGAIPGPGSTGGLVVNGGLNVTVRGTIDPHDRLSIRRTAEALYDELGRVAKHHG
jgi:hypothetical protein